MNYDIRIRYTYRRKSDGNIYQVVYPLGCMEDACKSVSSFCSMVNNELWETIGRDLWTGLIDKKNSWIFNNDLFEYEAHKGYSLPSFLAKVEWDEASASFVYRRIQIERGHPLELKRPFAEHDELKEDVLDYTTIAGNVYEKNTHLKKYGKRLTLLLKNTNSELNRKRNKRNK